MTTLSGVKFNKAERAERYKLDLADKDGTPPWRTHEEFDVAAIPINVEVLQNEGADFRFLAEDKVVADVAKMKELGVSAGDDVYVLGFPMRLAGTDRKYAVVRSGVIARLDDELISEQQGFWIDSRIYPGNSGGPVVLRPTPYGIEGTKVISAAYLIGIVSNYISYEDVAISMQTKRPRIVFEENSGLATVAPMDAVLGAFSSFMSERARAAAEPGETVTPHDVEGP